MVVRSRRRTVWFRGLVGVSAGRYEMDGAGGGSGEQSVRGRAPAVRQAMSDHRIVCRYWW